MTVKEVIDNLPKMSVSELDYLIGRYCGPHDLILCEKTFGGPLPRELIEQEILERTLLSNPVI
jgi:hypothetical protein